MADSSVNVHDVIAKANSIRREITTLESQLDELLEPIIVDAIKRGSIAEMTDLVARLPFGFHRSELRTHLNKLASSGE